MRGNEPSDLTHQPPQASIQVRSELRPHSRLGLALLSFALLWLGCFHAVACRYNVRDLGFFDQGPEAYAVYGYFAPGASPAGLSNFTQLATVELRESNLRFELVGPDTPTNHPAANYRERLAAEQFPAAILVSPDGQSLVVPLPRAADPSPESWTASLRSLVSSPTREQILREVTEAFGVILLIEGEESAANHRARQAVTEAIAQISAQMKTLPKAVSQPPVLVILERAAFEREKVLLWSLALAADLLREPHAAVLYGKARWVGPMMKGEEISAANLAGLFAVIGADCECGLDLSWTQGTRLPTRWDQARHESAARNLGFDPANPLIQVEVARILDRRTPDAKAAIGPRSAARESAPAPPGHSAASSAGRANLPSLPPPARPPALAQAEPPLFPPTVLWLGGIAVLILLTGAIIALRARPK